MYLTYVQKAADGSVQNDGDIGSYSNRATHVEIQADTNNVRYTMDDATDPTSTLGMLFLTTEPPKTFLIEDLKRIRWTAGSGGNGNLNFHFFGGRDV